MCKVCLNSLSGKPLQKVKESEMTLVSKFGKFVYEQRTLDKETVKVMNVLKDKYFHIGVNIYSLSKVHMYLNCYADNGFEDDRY